MRTKNLNFFACAEEHKAVLPRPSESPKDITMAAKNIERRGSGSSLRLRLGPLGLCSHNKLALAAKGILLPPLLLAWLFAPSEKGTALASMGALPPPTSKDKSGRVSLSDEDEPISSRMEDLRKLFVRVSGNARATPIQKKKMRRTELRHPFFPIQVHDTPIAERFDTDVNDPEASVHIYTLKKGDAVRRTVQPGLNGRVQIDSVMWQLGGWQLAGGFGNFPGLNGRAVRNLRERCGEFSRLSQPGWIDVAATEGVRYAALSPAKLRQVSVLDLSSEDFATVKELNLDADAKRQKAMKMTEERMRDLLEDDEFATVVESAGEEGGEQSYNWILKPGDEVTSTAVGGNGAAGGTGAARSRRNNGGLFGAAPKSMELSSMMLRRKDPELQFALEGTGNAMAFNELFMGRDAALMESKQALNKKDPLHYLECNLVGDIRGALQDLDLLEEADGSAPNGGNRAADKKDVREAIRQVDDWLRVPASYPHHDRFSHGDTVRVFMNTETCKAGYYRGTLLTLPTPVGAEWQVVVPGCGAGGTAGAETAAEDDDDTEEEQSGGVNAWEQKPEPKGSDGTGAEPVAAMMSQLSQHLQDEDADPSNAKDPPPLKPPARLRFPTAESFHAKPGLILPAEFADGDFVYALSPPGAGGSGGCVWQNAVLLSHPDKQHRDFGTSLYGAFFRDQAGQWRWRDRPVQKRAEKCGGGGGSSSFVQVDLEDTDTTTTPGTTTGAEFGPDGALITSTSASAAVETRQQMTSAAPAARDVGDAGGKYGDAAIWDLKRVGQLLSGSPDKNDEREKVMGAQVASLLNDELMRSMSIRLDPKGADRFRVQSAVETVQKWWKNDKIPWNKKLLVRNILTGENGGTATPPLPFEGEERIGENGPAPAAEENKDSTSLKQEKKPGTGTKAAGGGGPPAAAQENAASVLELHRQERRREEAQVEPQADTIISKALATTPAAPPTPVSFRNRSGYRSAAAVADDDTIWHRFVPGRLVMRALRSRLPAGTRSKKADKELEAFADVVVRAMSTTRAGGHRTAGIGHSPLDFAAWEAVVPATPTEGGATTGAGAPWWSSQLQLESAARGGAADPQQMGDGDADAQ
eukprot:g14119.t1